MQKMWWRPGVTGRAQRSWWRGAGLLMGGLLVSGGLHAQASALPGTVMTTTTGGPGPSEWAIEPWWQVDRDAPRGSDAHGTTAYAVQLPVKVRVAPNLWFTLVLNGAYAAHAHQHSQGVRSGDIGVALKYRLHEESSADRWPAVAVSLAHIFPSGRYEHLHHRPLNGGGAGIAATSLALYVQRTEGAPDRPWRWHVNMTRSLGSPHTKVHGASVYDTTPGFLGTYRAGVNQVMAVGVETLVSPRWAISLDVTDVRHWHCAMANDRTGQIEYPRSRHATVVTPGVTYSPSDTFSVAIGIGRTVRRQIGGEQTTGVVSLGWVL